MDRGNHLRCFVRIYIPAQPRPGQNVRDFVDLRIRRNQLNF